jgi:hypothetical protein
MRVDVDVEIDQFPEDEVLDYAAAILRQQAKAEKGLSKSARAIRSMLLADQEVAGLPPPSTAARITSMDELRAHCAASGLFA